MDRLDIGFEVKFADGAPEGTFSGYGAIFGNLDAFRDVIAKGAFKDTLRDWRKLGKAPPMLLQHGGWFVSDDDGLPIGKWQSLAEDDMGLRVEGRLINLDSDKGKRVYGALKEGVLDGLSIGYRVKKFTLGTKPDEPLRTLEKIDLVEVSLVTFPANQEARVDAVKADARVLSDPRLVEEAFRDGGFSQRDSKKAVSILRKLLQRDVGERPHALRDEAAEQRAIEDMRAARFSSFTGK